jgi:hypothetical protein
MKAIAHTILALAALCTSGYVFAQTCPSPGVLPSGGTVAGNTCGGDTSVDTFCGGATATGPTAAYAFSYNGTATSTITVSPTNATFDAAIAVISGGATCNASLTSTCNDLEDNGTGGATESTSIASGTETAAGTYYLLVTNLSGGAANVTCGPYSITAGTLPVKLQSFSVN